jgi:hypothetical protein
MLDNRQNVKHNETFCASPFMLGPRPMTIIDLTGFCLFPILTCPAILLLKNFPIEAKREGRNDNPVSL